MDWTPAVISNHCFAHQDKRIRNAYHRCANANQQHTKRVQSSWFTIARAVFRSPPTVPAGKIASILHDIPASVKYKIKKHLVISLPLIRGSSNAQSKCMQGSQGELAQGKNDLPDSRRVECGVWRVQVQNFWANG